MAKQPQPTVSDIPGLQSQIDRLQSEASSVQGRLYDSPTALGGQGEPTNYDVENQKELMKIQNNIQKLTNSKLRAQWYPPKDKTDEAGAGDASPTTLIGKGLDVLSRPLYGVVGAVKHVTGQGKGSLGQDVADNILRDKSTFGDVLKNTGMHYAVSAPLGFALDMAFDPVNWATMGTGALVPRLGAGLVKGATKGGVAGAARGLGAAAESSILGRAASVGKYIPYVKDTKGLENMAVRALRRTDEFENLTGTTAEALVQQRGAGIGRHRMGIGEIADRVADAVPGGAALRNHLNNYWKYDPNEWVRQAQIKDIFKESLGANADLRGAIAAKVAGEDITPFLAGAAEDVAKKIEDTPVGAVSNLAPGFKIDLDTPSTFDKVNFDKAVGEVAHTGLLPKLEAAAPDVVSEMDDAVTLAYNPKLGITTDPIENALRIVNEGRKEGVAKITLDDVQKIIESGALGDSGVKWFDDTMNWFRNTRKSDAKAAKIGAEVMKRYEQAIGIFRVSKVALSPASYLNGVVGNTIMHQMATGGISGTFLSRLKQSFDLMSGRAKGYTILDDLFMNEDMGAQVSQFFSKNPTGVRGTIGDFDMNSAERLLRDARDAFPAGTTAEDIVKDLKTTMSEIGKKKKELEIMKDLKSTAEKAVPNTVKGGTAMEMDKLRKGEKLTVDDLSGGIVSEILRNDATSELLGHIAQKAAADPNNLIYKALNFSLNKAGSGYESVDQIFKLTTFTNATIDGYTVNELRRLRNVIDIDPGDLTKYIPDGKAVNGYRYRLPPHKALELANVMYLNYNAMPAAIKVLRNLPLLGSPFVSFMYGMTLKTGQTLVYNPSAFNKVNFALNDFGGTETPLEKKALEGEYYNYLKKPGMFKLPFFDENPIYVNMSNMIPYYSLNLFDQNEQNYTGGTFGEGLANVVNRSPFLKDPIGQTLYSYMIQPMILGEAAAPQGQFGQPLYPVDADFLQKLGYGTRTMAEAFTPNALAIAGLVGGPMLPDSVNQMAPLYGYRSLAEATKGKNQIGIKTKEGALSRTTRRMLSGVGLPVQAPVDLTVNQNSSTNNTSGN